MTSDAQSGPRWWRDLWPLALIGSAVFIAYLPVWHGDFVWDDLLLIDKNPLVTGKLNLRSVWFQTDFPLSLAAFRAQWTIWGKHPAGYHVVNVLLHALGSILVWRALQKIGVRAAWLAAALFAVHPVAASSVAWISELKNTLSLCFLSLSLGWALDAEVPDTDLKAASLDHPRVRYALSLLAFCLALLSKTSTVMLPVLLLLCAWWRRRRITGREWTRTLPFFGLSLLFGLLTIWFQRHQAMAGASSPNENWAARTALAGKALWFYFAHSVAPLNLSMIYPLWTFDPSSAATWIPLASWLLFLGICCRLPRGRAITFALVSFTALLLPVLGLLDMYYLNLSRVADHLQYLALIPFTALAASAWDALPVSRLRDGLAVGILGLLAILTFQRAAILSHEDSLWRETLQQNPESWTAHNNLACWLAERGRLPEAIPHFETSLSLRPENAQAHVNLARALAIQGRLPEAEAHLRTALTLKPDDADIHLACADELEAQGKPAEAVAHLREAVRLEPKLDTRLRFAGLLFRLRHQRDAVDEYRAVLAADANQPEALNNLAWMLATSPDPSLRDGTAAVQAAERAARLAATNDPIPWGTLAAACAEAGRFEAAISNATHAVDLALAQGNPGFADINRRLIQLYRAGRPFHEPAGPGPAQP